MKAVKLINDRGDTHVRGHAPYQRHQRKTVHISTQSESETWTKVAINFARDEIFTILTTLSPAQSQVAISVSPSRSAVMAKTPTGEYPNR